MNLHRLAEQRSLAYHRVLLDFMGSDGERARELRQSTPFAGMLDPRERWHLWAQVRRQFDA